jgi:hypothetical protein
MPEAVEAAERLGVPEPMDDGDARKEISRREAVQLLAALPAAAFLSWPTAQQEKARNFVSNAARRSGRHSLRAQVFTAAEYRTVRCADMIIPKDERSGSASTPGFRSSWTSP